MPDPSRRVQRAARRVADQQTARLAQPPRDRPFFATVATVTPGAATDGRAVVAVTRRGADLTAASYDRDKTFVVGDRVKCQYIDDQLHIDCVTGGFPPES